MKRTALVTALLLAPLALAADTGEEVELSAGAVTALSCAQAAKKTGKLELLGACPLSEAKKGLVVYDVAEKEIYRLAPKKVATWELEQAWGGGSIDLTGTVTKKDKDGVPVVEVAEYSVTPKAKPGAFKGCL